MAHQKTKTIYSSLVVLLLIVIVAFFLSSFVGGVTQPIQFNHAVHKKQGIDCFTCHVSAKSAPWASLPGVDVCMMCHEEALTQSEEEEKIREYAKSGNEIPWERLFEVPAHVYFSHQRHVSFGKLECSSCHADMGEQVRPPRKAPQKITMEGCMDCHEEYQVLADCTTCHR